MEMQTVNTDKILHVGLNEQKWNIILSALNEAPMPHRISNPLITELLEILRPQAQAMLTTEDVERVT